MARSLTNKFSLQVTKESALGVAGTIWHLLEPNTIGSFGSEITTVPRAPISKNRQRRKGTTTDLDSSVDFEHDLTMHVFEYFVDGFVFADFIGPMRAQAGAGFQTLAAVAATPEFTHTALTAAIPAGSLIKTRKFTNAGNNGVFEVDTGSTTTSTPIVSGTLVNETPAQTTGALLEVCGVRGATADITWTNATNTIGSTALDFTTLRLTVGQFIHVGGTTTTNQFAGGVARGRIVSISATAIVLDKVTKTLAGDDAGAGKNIDLLFGRFLRNVSVDHADYFEQSYQFEGAYDNLDNPGPAAEYEYPLGNYCNEMSFQLPLTDKALISFAFVGTDTDTPTTSRKTGASTPVLPVKTEALNTSADIVRLRITDVDENGLTTDFKSANITLNNNVTGEKVLGFLGSKYLNTGIFEVNLEAQILFTDSEVIAAIRANDTVTMEWWVTNDDGAIAVDIPSMTLGGGGRDFPVNETILCNLTGEAFEDADLGYSVGISTFPVYP
jgi:hypothetical protein